LAWWGARGWRRGRISTSAFSKEGSTRISRSSACRPPIQWPKGIGPISPRRARNGCRCCGTQDCSRPMPAIRTRRGHINPYRDSAKTQARSDGGKERSEEHTSELQSLRHLVCRLLLEKKKKK